MRKDGWLEDRIGDSNGFRSVRGRYHSNFKVLRVIYYKI